MFKETYKRTKLDITLFDAEDIIITSGEEPTPTPPAYDPTGYENPLTIP